MPYGLQAFGESAWRRGIRAAVRSAEERLKTASTDEQRQSAQAELDALQRQQRDEQRNGLRRLY